MNPAFRRTGDNSHYINGRLLINKTGDIVFRNAVFSNLINQNHNNLFHFMSEDSLVKFNEDVMQATEHHKIISNNLKLQKTTDESLYFTYYLFPLESKHALILVDNTSIYNKNIMFNNIINTVPDPIFVKDKKHRFMFVNQAFLESLGCKIEDALGKSDVDFFSEEESKVFYRLDRKTFKSEKTTINEESLTSKKYGSLIVSTKKSIFKTAAGNKILVGICHDITEVKKAREALKKHAKELKEQVKERTKELEERKNDLEQAVEKLKNLNSDLDCFAHICCHELKEPLRTISSFSTLALREYEDRKVEEVMECLKIIKDGTSRMDKLINSVLEYSTNGLRTNSMKFFSASDMISEVLSMLSIQIQEKNATISYDQLPIIYADSLQVIQLFQNLITNAIKFNKYPKTPFINITANIKDAFVEFQIKDNGIGIPKEYHKEIFLPFKRFHSRHEGSSYGIGLNLCKKIVENHGGSIKVSSQEDVGTTFKFMLPTQAIS
jgi:PAS domain S-box-containing protein